MFSLLISFQKNQLSCLNMLNPYFKQCFFHNSGFDFKSCTRLVPPFESYADSNIRKSEFRSQSKEPKPHEF